MSKSDYEHGLEDGIGVGKAMRRSPDALEAGDGEPERWEWTCACGHKGLTHQRVTEPYPICEHCYLEDKKTVPITYAALVPSAPTPTEGPPVINVSPSGVRSVKAKDILQSEAGKVGFAKSKALFERVSSTEGPREEGICTAALEKIFSEDYYNMIPHQALEHIQKIAIAALASPAAKTGEPDRDAIRGIILAAIGFNPVSPGFVDHLVDRLAPAATEGDEPRWTAEEVETIASRTKELEAEFPLPPREEPENE